MVRPGVESVSSLSEGRAYRERPVRQGAHRRSHRNRSGLDPNPRTTNRSFCARADATRRTSIGMGGRHHAGITSRVHRNAQAGDVGLDNAVIPALFGGRSFGIVAGLTARIARSLWFG
jgi:hypothetical protein